MPDKKSLGTYESKLNFSDEETKTINNSPNKEIERNRVILSKIDFVDTSFYAYIASLNRERRGTSLFSRVSVIGLTTASAILTPVATKSILSGTAAAVAGTDVAVSSEIYDDLNSTAIITQMLASRKRISERIKVGMGKLIADYPVYVAELDIMDYFRAGSYLMASTELITSASASSETSLTNTLRLNYGRSENAEKIRTWLLKPDPDPNRKGKYIQDKIRLEILIKWLNENSRFINAINQKSGVEVKSITDKMIDVFLFGDTYSDLQNEFVEKNGLISK